MKDEQPPLQFHNPAKIIKQMRKRRITADMIREAMTYAPTHWRGKDGPALMYKSEQTGTVVLIDAQAGTIFHVGTGRFRYDDF